MSTAPGEVRVEKRLTDEDLVDVERRAQVVGDDAILTLLAEVRARRASLSPPTPEEVAVNADAIAAVIPLMRSVLDGKKPDRLLRSRLVGCEKALTRLRDWAARAQGLEAKTREMADTVIIANNRMVKAESERDAARKEAAQARAGLVAVLEEHNAEPVGNDTADLIEGAVEVTKTGRERQTDAEEGRDALRSQVATLETDLSNVRRLHGKTILDGSAAVTRAEAAERRVAELEETLGRKQMAIHGLMETTAEEPTTQPAPAGLLEAVRRIIGRFCPWDTEGRKYIQPVGHEDDCRCCACELLAAFNDARSVEAPTTVQASGPSGMIVRTPAMHLLVERPTSCDCNLPGCTGCCRG